MQYLEDLYPKSKQKKQQFFLKKQQFFLKTKLPKVFGEFWNRDRNSETFEKDFKGVPRNLQTFFIYNF